MSTTVVVCKDPRVRSRVEKAASVASIDVAYVEDESDLENAFKLHPGRVLVDLNIPWTRDVIDCISHCRRTHEGVEIIAFLHEYAGETAIRASIAGANRVIPQAQLESEIEEILRGDE